VGKPVTRLALLDQAAVPRAWEVGLGRAARDLHSTLKPSDRALLTPLHALVQGLLVDGGEQAGHPETGLQRRHTRLQVPDGAHDTHPIGVTLLRWKSKLHDSGKSDPGLTLLTAILVAAAWGPDGSIALERKRQVGLSSIIRGGLENENAPLRVLLAGIDTIPGMVHALDAHLQSESVGLHPGFEELWRKWLGFTLTRWMLADPAAIRRTLEPRSLVPSLLASVVPVLGSSGADPDDQTDVKNAAGDEAGEELPSSRSRVAAAQAKELLRASVGDVLLPAEHFAPESLIKRLARGAMLKAEGLSSDRLRESAEPPAALALAIATFLREIDLPSITWGAGDRDTEEPVLDLERPILYRTIKRPPDAINPPPVLDPLLHPHTDRDRWPIPGRLHRMLRTLAPSDTPVSGSAVLPQLASSSEVSYRLRDELARLEPNAQIGAGRLRLAGVADFSRKFGSEVAQQVFGDSFSLSVAPAYYSAVPDAAIGAWAAQRLASWFGEEVLAPVSNGAFIGSRLALTDEAAQAWPSGLRQQYRVAVHRKSARQAAWVAHRNLLAAALCAVTGHRPVNEIGMIKLDSVIPEHGLIVLRDKQSDSLRRVRIAATGRRWISDLRDYLDRLMDVETDAAGTAEGDLASAILRGERPLFDAPGQDGQVMRMDAAALRATMPAPLEMVPNHYRHYVNQYLQGCGVDPELRHAQLGWVVSPAHATADLSPYSPIEFATRIGPFLDDLLVKNGWYARSQRLRQWDWKGVPLRPAPDWQAAIQAHEGDHAQELRRIREQLRIRGLEIKAQVLPKLAVAIADTLPPFCLRIEGLVLERKHAVSRAEPVHLTADHYGLICDRVQAQDEKPADAMEAAVTRSLLSNIFRKARVQGLVEGALPSRPYFSVTSEPSPFLPNIGLALRHAGLIREALLKRAAEQRSHDQNPLVQMLVLAYSPYRDLTTAAAAAAGAREALRSRRHPDWLRLPAVVHGKELPIVFGGLAAAAVGRRGVEAPTARPWPASRLGRWLREVLGDAIAFDGDDKDLVERVVGTFRMAGRVELSGQERSIMLGGAVAAVSTRRALARDDDWPLRTLGAEDATEDERAFVLETREQPAPPAAMQGGRVNKDYETLTSLLNRRVTSTQSTSRSDGHRDWRGKLRRDLEGLQRQVGEKSNLGLLVGFSLHRLRFGGVHRKKLAQGTLHNEMTRFGRELLVTANGVSLLSNSAEDFQVLYLALLHRKVKSIRADVLEELRRFHRYLVDVHHAPAISFAELATLAGHRVRNVDAGAFTSIEVNKVLEVLFEDLKTERARADVSPAVIRLGALRILIFLILEASGIRPSSAYGLTLGDLHLDDQHGDFVHVRRTGEFGEAKTETSIGFISLDGEVWQAHRSWVKDWLQGELAQAGDQSACKLPLFAEAAATQRRFTVQHLTERLNALFKWASAESKARTYWLRKNRVTERHRRAAGSETPWARDVYAALCASGHAIFQVAAGRYVSDAGVLFRSSFKASREEGRTALLRVTGLSAPRLDMAWSRLGDALPAQRLATVFDRLKLPYATPQDECLTAPPPLRRHQQLGPRHLEIYAKALHRTGSKQEGMLRSGLTDQQVALLDAIGSDLMMRRGCVPWQVPGLKDRRGVLAPPRRIAGSEKLLALLDMPADTDLLELANAWVEYSYLAPIHGARAVVVAKAGTDFGRIVALMQRHGVDLDVSLDADGRCILAGKDVGRRRVTLVPVLDWVLSILWIFARFCGEVASPMQKTG
jgi:hypothetical protein